MILFMILWIKKMKECQMRSRLPQETHCNSQSWFSRFQLDELLTTVSLPVGLSIPWPTTHVLLPFYKTGSHFGHKVCIFSFWILFFSMGVGPKELQLSTHTISKQSWKHHTIYHMRHISCTLLSQYLSPYVPS